MSKRGATKLLSDSPVVEMQSSDAHTSLSKFPVIALMIEAIVFYFVAL